jgi:hypothetical protein
MSAVPSQSTDTLSQALGSGLGSSIDRLGKATTSKEMQPIVGEQLQESMKASSALEEKKAKAVSDAATRERQSTDELASQEKTGLEELGKTRKDYAAFEPTKENGKDLAAMFGLVNAMAFMSGGGGRYSGMAALNNMAGAMEGYKKGRKDLFEQEMKSFDKNLAATKAHNDQVNQKIQEFFKLMSIDKEKATAKLKEISAIDAGGIAAYYANSQNTKALYEYGQKLMDSIRKAEEAKSHLKQTYDLEMAKIRERALVGQGRAADKSFDAGAMIKEKTGANLSPKDNAEVAQTAGSMGEMYSLLAQVKKDPDIVGRPGQVQSFFNRYVESFTKGGQPPDENVPEQDQKALLFAKKYAAALVDYERSLAGGARGFTVQFQNRFNKLMAQEQFTPDGLASLMEEQTREMARKAVTKSPKLNYDNLSDLGVDILSRSGSPDAQEGWNIVKGRHGAKPNASGKYSVGQVIDQGGKKYRVTGLSDPNDPDIEEVK